MACVGPWKRWGTWEVGREQQGQAPRQKQGKVSAHTLLHGGLCRCSNLFTRGKTPQSLQAIREKRELVHPSASVRPGQAKLQ